MISEHEITRGQEIPEEYKENLKNLLKAVNILREKYGSPMFVTSGYRSPEHNASIGGAKSSNHCKCSAVDFIDTDGSLKEFCRHNDYEILKEAGLWMESGEVTKNWLHVQIVKTSQREFNP